MVQLADLAAPKAAGIKTAFLDNQPQSVTPSWEVGDAAPDYYSYDFTATGTSPTIV